MLPNLIVIGAMKAGTTSLHHYLSLHPEIFMSADKEPSFFTVEKNWDRGIDWYSSLFPTTDTKIRGEASPDYTKYPAIGGVAARIRAVLPDVRLIYLVREPLDRIVSHYVDAYSFGRIHKPIEQELADFESHHFVNCSRYYMQLEKYLEHFDRTRVLVITSKELREDRNATMKTVFGYLGVDTSFSTPEFANILYTGDEKRRKTRIGYALTRTVEQVGRSRIRPYLSPRLAKPVHAFNTLTGRRISRPELTGALRQEIADFLRPDVARLREFTGKPLADWLVPG